MSSAFIVSRTGNSHWQPLRGFPHRDAIIGRARHHGRRHNSFFSNLNSLPLSLLNLNHHSTASLDFSLPTTTARRTSLFDFDFDDEFNTILALDHSSSGRVPIPVGHVEATESDSEFQVQVEVPGVPQDNINITIDKGVLRIKGKGRKSLYENSSDTLSQEAQTDAVDANAQDANASATSSCTTTSSSTKGSSQLQSEKKSKSKAQHRHSGSGSRGYSQREFSYAYHLPVGVDEGGIVATVENGLLKVTVPKIAPPQAIASRVIPITTPTTPISTEVPVVAQSSESTTAIDTSASVVTVPVTPQGQVEPQDATAGAAAGSGADGTPMSVDHHSNSVESK